MTTGTNLNYSSATYNVGPTSPTTMTHPSKLTHYDRKMEDTTNWPVSGNLAPLKGGAFQVNSGKSEVYFDAH